MLESDAALRRYICEGDGRRGLRRGGRRAFRRFCVAVGFAGLRFVVWLLCLGLKTMIEQHNSDDDE